MNVVRGLPLALAVAMAACGGSSSGGDLGPDVGLRDVVDADSDTISDADEGAPIRDTDRDGTPDYLDLDSDDDGLADSIEAGDALLSTPPVNSDADSLPDFQDLDSDGNLIPDADEGTDDFGADGILDYADLDDDDDTLLDVGEMDPERPGVPPDTDGDGQPDYRDLDSDGDTILDRDESPNFPLGLDQDRDGLPNHRDLDADGDGIPDREEAGDDDPETAPVQSGERLPDFRSLDADGDGLGDAREAALGTERTMRDSDGDFADDLVEVALGTDPLDRDDQPFARGVVVMVSPFDETPRGISGAALRFETRVERLDAYLAVDRTASMSDSLATLRAELADVLAPLTCTTSGTTCATDDGCGRGEVCVDGACREDPADAGCAPSVWTGVGSYAGGERSFRQELAMQSLPSAVEAAVPDAELTDGDEALLDAASCIADRAACDPLVRCASSGRGCPGFRDDALRVAVVVSDGPAACRSGAPPEPACDNRGVAANGVLRDGRLRPLAVDPASETGRHDELLDLARAGGGDQTTGRPHLVEAADDTLADDLARGLRTLVRELTFEEVRADLVDDPEDALDIAELAGDMEIAAVGGGCDETELVLDPDDDGRPEVYARASVGLTLCWSVRPFVNLVRMAQCEPEVYRGEIVVTGDGVLLGRRTVAFVVPPNDAFCAPGSPLPECRCD